MKMISFWLSRLSVEDKKILKFAFYASILIGIVTICLAPFIDWWSYLWGPCLLLGNLASSICYIKLVNNITDLLNGCYSHIKRKMFINNMFSMVIYFIFLTISVLLNTYAIFWCALGIFSVKIVIYITSIKNRKGGV